MVTPKDSWPAQKKNGGSNLRGYPQVRLCALIWWNHLVFEVVCNRWGKYIKKSLDFNYINSDSRLGGSRSLWISCSGPYEGWLGSLFRRNTWVGSVQIYCAINLHYCLTHAIDLGCITSKLLLSCKPLCSQKFYDSLRASKKFIRIYSQTKTISPSWKPKDLKLGLDWGRPNSFKLKRWLIHYWFWELRDKLSIWGDYWMC